MLSHWDLPYFPRFQFRPFQQKHLLPILPAVLHGTHSPLGHLCYIGGSFLRTSEAISNLSHVLCPTSWLLYFSPAELTNSVWVFMGGRGRREGAAGHHPWLLLLLASISSAPSTTMGSSHPWDRFTGFRNGQLSGHPSARMKKAPQWSNVSIFLDCIELKVGGDE